MAKILVIVNPIGGGGRALSIYEREVKPLLEEGKVNFESYLTKRSKEAFELARDLDYKKYSALVSVSGDGMFHEIVNGLKCNKDYPEVFKKIKLGVIPAGTGNGLAASLGFFKDVRAATMAVVNDTTTSSDVILVRTDDGEEQIAAMCTSWGFIGDHDHFTEVEYRWMGPSVSTTIAPVVCFLSKRIYKGKVSFIPKTIPENGKFLKQDHIKVTKNEDWYSFDGEFWGISVCNTSHIASDCHLAPGAKNNDGSIHLVIIHSCSYWDAFGILTGFERGVHVQSQYVDFIPVITTRLEPEEKGFGFLDLDGEVVPSKNATLEVIPGLTTLYSKEASP